MSNIIAFKPRERTNLEQVRAKYAPKGQPIAFPKTATLTEYSVDGTVRDYLVVGPNRKMLREYRIEVEDRD